MVTLTAPSPVYKMKAKVTGLVVIVLADTALFSTRAFADTDMATIESKLKIPTVKKRF